MKTFFTTAIAVLLAASLQAQDKTNDTEGVVRRNKSADGLVLISGARHREHQYRGLNRLNYWSSRFDRYCAKYERIVSGNWSTAGLRSTRNLSRLRNDWSSDQYSTQNRKDVKRKDGLIKIN